jgi:Hg(II)-responsive transcriptional regulator
MLAMTIARAARAAGVGVETIRFYERRGLIAQPRKPTDGFREYDSDIVARIRFIRQAQELGFSLREIGELLSLRADPGADCVDVRARAITKRDEVERKIAQLGQIRAALDALIASCPGGGALRACTILDAIEQAPTAKASAGRERRPRTQGN